ncbi:MAG: hemerythrin domain-containing protein [Syntrophobacter sp.]
MRPTEELKQEHSGILRILDVVEKISEKITGGESVPIVHIKQILEFIQVFVDKCHHGKEEDILFPAMEAAGIPREGGPIGMMLTEHEMGRKLTADMNKLVQAHEDGGSGSLMVLTNPALQYVNLLRSHIWKENNVLYPMGDEKLSPEQQDYISREFERLEAERIGPGRHEAFHKLIDTLSEIYG